MKEIKKLDTLIKLRLNLNKISKRIKNFNEYSGFILSRASWKQIVEFEKNKFLFNLLRLLSQKRDSILIKIFHK